MNMLRALRANLILTIILGWSSAAFANVVFVDAKEFDNQTVLVFHHDRWTSIAPSFLGHHGRVRASSPITMSVKSALVNKLCDNIRLNSDGKNTIDFRLNNGYRFQGTIYGENLIAFKLKNLSLPDKSVEEDKQELVKTEEAAAREVEIKIQDNSSPSKRTNEDVSIVDSKVAKQLSFPFKEKNVGAAVFQRGPYMWIIFDVRKDFVIDKNSYIESWDQYADIHNTIIKLKLKDNFYATTSKQGNNWVVKFSPKNMAPKFILAPESINDSLVSIKQMSDAKNAITFRDQDVGDVLMVVPLPKAGFGIAKERTMVDYHILPSAQGLAISLISEDVKLSYNNSTKSIDISSRYVAPLLGKHDEATMQAGTILPIHTPGSDDFNFTVIKQSLMEKILSAKDDVSKFNAQLELAKFYFKHGMYHESLGVLNLAQKSSTALAKGLLPSLMKAVTLIFTAQPLDARAEFVELKNNFSTSSSIYEIELWHRYNEALLGNAPESIGVLDSKLLSFYPDDVYWKFILAELELLIDRKNLKLADTVLNNVRITEDTSINNNLKFYRSQYYYLQNQVNLAQQLLEDIEKNAQNGRDFLMADLQLVKILYEQQRMDWISAVQRLNQLRFVWRGDKLEMKLLMSLALAYKQNKDVINAIRTYKYIVDSFGRQSDNNFFVTSQIVELYHRIFLSDEMQELDDFNVVALFYEFKDFTPIGSEGDKVVLGIARRMLNLDLLEMATEILEHQVMYRLRGVERMVTANHLALVLLMDKKPVVALKVLNDTDKENFGFAEHQKRRYLKASALINLGKYDDALNYIGDDQNSDSYALKGEIFFRSHKWADYIKLVETNLKKMIADGEVIKGPESQNILRLAIAYSMLNRLSDLDYLQQHIITENGDLKSVIEFLKSTNKPIDPHNIDKSLNIDHMQNFLDGYKQLLFN